MVAQNQLTDAFKDSVPWIQYTGQGDSSATKLLKKTLNDAGYSIALQMETGESKGKSLQFKLAQYDIEGNFKGYLDLSS